MKYYLFIDDSGNMHANSPNAFFCYGGLLVSNNNLQKLKTNYKLKVKGVKQSQNLDKNSELKASNMSLSIKRHLLNNLGKNCLQVFAIMKLDLLDRVNLHDKKDIVRFKNFAIRFLIQGLIYENHLQDCTELNIQIDNQNIAVSAKDSLEDYLYKAFNFDDYYTSIQTPVKSNNHINFIVEYKSSDTHYLIQAADLLANTKWRKFERQDASSYKFLQAKAYCTKLPNDSFSSGKY